MSSTIKCLPSTLINDPRRQKESRLTIERHRVPGIFQNAISGSARRRMNSAGDLTFNQLGFLDKSDSRAKNSKKCPASSSISTQVQLSSVPSSRPNPKQSTKITAIPISAHQQMTSSHPSSRSNIFSASNQVFPEVKSKKKSTQDQIVQQRIPASRVLSHSDHTSAHSACSLMVRKKMKIANKTNDRSPTQKSANNSIPPASEPRDQLIHQSVSRSSLLSHLPTKSKQLSDHYARQTRQTYVNLNSKLDSQDFEQKIQDPRIDPSLFLVHHHPRAQQLSLGNTQALVDPIPHIPNEARVTPNHNEINAQSLFSLSSCPILDDPSIANEESFRGAESWIENDRLDDIITNSGNEGKIPMNDFYEFDDDSDSRHVFLRRYSSCSSPSSEHTILTQLEPQNEFGYLDYQPATFQSGSIRNDDNDNDREEAIIHEIQMEDNINNDDSLDEAQWSIYKPRRIITRTDIDESEIDDIGIDWPAVNDRVNESGRNWNRAGPLLSPNFDYDNYYYESMSPDPLIANPYEEIDWDETHFDDYPRALESNDYNYFYDSKAHTENDYDSLCDQDKEDENFAEEGEESVENPIDLNPYHDHDNYYNSHNKNDDGDDYHSAQSVDYHALLFSGVSDDRF